MNESNKGVLQMAVNYMEDFDFSKLMNYRAGGATKPSPDQYVGQLIVDESRIIFKQEKRDSVSYHDETFSFESKNTYPERNVLVILESPHRFEYDHDNNPCGLAMGKTGDNFFKLFAYALKQSVMKLREGVYSVILSNAIQYQTSCGLNPLERKLRDDNWIDIYDNYGGETDFKKRVFSIKPRYTMNLCTGGRNPLGLRAKVSKSLDAFGLKKNKHYAEGNHPASWDYHGDTKNARIY